MTTNERDGGKIDWSNGDAAWRWSYETWCRLVEAYCPELLLGFSTINVRCERGAGFAIDSRFAPRGTVRTQEQAMRAVLFPAPRIGNGTRETSGLLVLLGSDPVLTARVFMGATCVALAHHGECESVHARSVQAVRSLLRRLPRPPVASIGWSGNVGRPLPDGASLLHEDVVPLLSIRSPEDVVRFAAVQASMCRLRYDVVARIMPGHGDGLGLTELPVGAVGE